MSSISPITSMKLESLGMPVCFVSQLYSGLNTITKMTLKKMYVSMGATVLYAK